MNVEHLFSDVADVEAESHRPTLSISFGVYFVLRKGDISAPGLRRTNGRDWVDALVGDLGGEGRLREYLSRAEVLIVIAERAARAFIKPNPKTNLICKSSHRV